MVVVCPAMGDVRRNKSKVAIAKFTCFVAKSTYSFAMHYIGELPCVLLVERYNVARTNGDAVKLV